MRQIVLDTETTGLDAAAGHRVVEIGCVELIDRHRTNNDFHAYLNPRRACDPRSLAVHGLDQAFLADKPQFEQVADRLFDYLNGAELIAHNASFDIEFLDAEFGRLGRFPTLGSVCRITDSLKLARERHPGRKNSLDALCQRYGVDGSRRTRHGAMLDASLLAEVYLAMTVGQDDLFADPSGRGASQEHGATKEVRGNLELPANERLRVLRASAEEIAAHEAYLDMLDDACEQGSVWRSEQHVWTAGNGKRRMD